MQWTIEKDSNNFRENGQFKQSHNITLTEQQLPTTNLNFPFPVPIFIGVPS